MKTSCLIPIIVLAASPKVLANFPWLASGYKTESNKLMAACNCFDGKH